MSVKLIGGPLAGRMIELPASAEKFVVGRMPRPFWVYTYAGKDGQQVMFAKQPLARVGRRFIRAFIENTGRHPAVESEVSKQQPARGRTVRTGQGARKRTAARAAKVA